jgi:membrane-associated protease RseP (regulator of RpoE activity)
MTKPKRTKTMTNAAGARRRWIWLALLPAALALTIATGRVHAAAGTGGTTSTTDTQDRAALEKQLDDARSRLDDAARDVAELTQKLHGDAGGDVIRMFHGGPQGAMIGINIGGEQGRTDGIEVKGVSPSGPAEQAGLKTGDVLTAIDGKTLAKSADRSSGRQLVEYLRGVQPGQSVKVDYLRDGKKGTATIKTVAAEPPMLRMLREHGPMMEGMHMPMMEEFMGGPGRGFRSLELVSITPKLGQYFGTDKGLLVVRAPEGAQSKLQDGDVILTIGGRTPENPRHAFRILGSYQPSEKVKVEVLRQRKRMTLDLDVPDTGDDGDMFRHGPPPPARAPMPPIPPAAPAPATPTVSS